MGPARVNASIAGTKFRRFMRLPHRSSQVVVHSTLYASSRIRLTIELERSPEDQGNRTWPKWEGEAPAEPRFSSGIRLGGSLALPYAIALTIPDRLKALARSCTLCDTG